MNRLRYKIRGLCYWAECANPLRSTVTARRLPLGLRIQGYKRDAVGRGLYRRGVHEPALTEVLLDKFSHQSGSNFVDIGANIGYFSCLLGKLAGPTGRVVAIEPESQNRKLLERNLKLNGLTNVTVHGCAAGATNSVARMGLYKSANRGRHSLVDLASCRRFVDVPVRKLDDLVNGFGVKRWALVKIDVEGYEPFVFEGAEETLSRTEMLAMEFAPSYWRMAGIDPGPVFRKLVAYFPRMFLFEGSNFVAVSSEQCSRSEITLDLMMMR